MNRFAFVFICLYFTGCDTASTNSDESFSISVSEEFCSGAYKGPEFMNGSDVAHQFSNEMCAEVGDKLKELYRSGHYSKVDFSKIKMSTKGMGSGEVIYKLLIPFILLENKCDAMTSFDHSGGWDHAPAIESRKNELESVLMSGEELDISELKTTPEGLQEYWIQWKNKEEQADCADSELLEF